MTETGPRLGSKGRPSESIWSNARTSTCRRRPQGRPAIAPVMLLCPGICYRRDSIDMHHVGEPHQLDVWRIRNNGPALERSDLEELTDAVVEAAVGSCRWRLVGTGHPYTLGGVQVDVLEGDTWLEIAECGLAHPDVLCGSGLSVPPATGLAMGLGLDRLLMLRKGIDDIRLLRASDPRIATQMLDLEPYRPVSSMPPVRRDLSIAVDTDVTEELLGDRARAALDDEAPSVEQLEVVSETPYDELPVTARERLGIRAGQKNMLVRVVLRDLERTLTDADANRLRDRIYTAIHEGTAWSWAVDRAPDATIPRKYPEVDSRRRRWVELRHIEAHTRAMLRRDRSRGLKTLVFTDLVGSTDIAVELGDRRWRVLQAKHHAEIRRLLKKHVGHEVDTAGDGFFATFQSPAEGIRCTAEIVHAVRRLGLEVRAGIHVGEAELTGEKVSGIAVTTAARVAALASAGEVLATDTVVHTVAGSDMRFTDVGIRDLKGVPGQWQLFALASVDGQELGQPLDQEQGRRLRSDAAPAPVERSGHRVVAAVAVGAVVLIGIALAVTLLGRGTETVTPPAEPESAAFAALEANTGEIDWRLAKMDHISHSAPPPTSPSYG